MSRPTLSLARAPAQPARPPLVKRAIRLFKGRGVPKETYRKNAIKWLAANQSLGARHLLKGGTATWGHPGEPDVRQVHAPRRYGAK